MCWWIWSSPAVAADLNVGAGQTYATIEDALHAADPGDRILPDPGIHFVSSQVIEVDVEIDGAGAATLQAGPDGDGWMFQIGGPTLTLRDIQIDASGFQALQLTGGGLSLDQVSLFNASGMLGAAVHATGGVVDINTSVLSGNSALQGPDLYLDGGQATVRDTLFVGSFGSLSSSIQVNQESSLTLERTSFQELDPQADSTIQALGPATLVFLESDVVGADVGDFLLTRSASVSLVSSRFESVTSRGNVVNVTGGDLTIDDSTFIRNQSENQTIYAGISTVTVSRNLFCDNTPGSGLFKLFEAGGQFQNNVVLRNSNGLDIYSELEVSNNHFVANSAQGNGSSMHVQDGGQVTAVNNLVVENTDLDGLTMVSTGEGPLQFTYGLVWGNTPELAGTTVFSDPSNLSEDPLLTVPTDCTVHGLIPPPGSPAIDAGDPSRFDTDGSRSDIGAFGGSDPFTRFEWPDEDEDGFSSDIDCDDNNNAVFPGATEVGCDQLDNDCDPTTADAALESCNGFDDDCDGEIDEAPIDGEFRFLDVDGDGFGAGDALVVCATGELAVVSGDCDDANPSVFPGATDLRDDGVDQDCDGIDLVTRLDGFAGCATSPHPTATLGWLALLLFSGRRRCSAR